MHVRVVEARLQRTRGCTTIGRIAAVDHPFFAMVAESLSVAVYGLVAQDVQRLLISNRV
jgi:hypothetical protein